MQKTDIDYGADILIRILQQLPESCQMDIGDFINYENHVELCPYFQHIGKYIILDLTNEVRNILITSLTDNPWGYMDFIFYQIHHDKKVLVEVMDSILFEISNTLDIPEEWISEANSGNLSIRFSDNIPYWHKADQYIGLIFKDIFSQMPEESEYVGLRFLDSETWPELSSVIKTEDKFVKLYLSDQVISILCDNLKKNPQRCGSFYSFDIFNGNDHLVHGENGSFYIHPQFILDNDLLDKIPNRSDTLIVTDKLPHPWFYRDDEYPGMLIYNLLPLLVDDCRMIILDFNDWDKYPDLKEYITVEEGKIIVDLSEKGKLVLQHILHEHPDIYWDFQSFCIMNDEKVYLKGVDRKILRILSMFTVSDEYITKCKNAGIEIIYNSSIIPLR